MPLSSKSAGGFSPNPSSAMDHGEPPSPQAERRGPDQDPEEQGDPDITKSPSDPKTYRYIELPNGLRALLISDLSSICSTDSISLFSTETSGESSGESECESSGESECESSGETENKASGEREDTPVMKSSDKQEAVWSCCWRCLKRVLEQMSSCFRPQRDRAESDTDLSSSYDGDTAAAALCVAVGSFSDPEDIPGLAHFLEHMVFMGSEKFPEENGFDSFLKKHGGSDNGSTDCERTVFHFCVEKTYFREALDRWAQFFICPLMIKDAVDRELEAVDSEFQQARPSNTHRREMLFGTLVKPGHPMGKFCWGNAQTLKLDPKEKGINTYQRLREFWRRHYSAQYMTLAVQSRESLDTLEKWVRDIFVHVPNNGEAAVDFSHLQEPFDTPDFTKLYRVVPVKKVHALSITWALPPQGKYYRVKPLHYIAWLIGHEGLGSILSLLRKKCWALALFGGNTESGFEQNSTSSLFSVTITLTEQGHAHFYQVAHVLFQYLKMLQTLGPQQRIYQEIQKIMDNEFHYQEQMDPADFVECICENMQLFPKEDVLTGDELLFEFDPQVISSALSHLTPLKANFMLLSPDNEGQCDLTEKWFGTSYSREDVPQEWTELWASDFELNPDLHLPHENRFITTDFSLREPNCPDTQFPVRIELSDRGALWYKKDTTFKIPKAHIRFHLISPVVQRSPETLVLFDLFVNILAHNLSETAYEANVAQLSYRLVAAEHGLVIRLEGFNHKLPLLLKLIVDHVADFSAEPCVFQVFSEQLKKAYFNMLLNPERLGRDIRLQILEPARWSVLHKLQEVERGLNVERLMDFVSEFKQQLFTEGLVQGNVTHQESREFLRYFIDKLQFQPLPAEAPVQFRVVELPQKHHLCKVQSLNLGDPNSEVTVYYQSGLKNLREHTLMELLVSHMEEPCFDFLRTKETLGYQVYPSYRNTQGVLGFSVTVSTQATKFSSELVESKVEEFLQAFGGRLSSLSAEAVEAQVEALVKLKQSEDAHLREEVDRNWSEVVTQQYVFDRVHREVKALQSFSKDDLLQWFTSLRDDNRKLSVHVVGFGAAENNATESTAEGAVGSSSSYADIKELQFLPASSPWLQQATPISDISAFNTALPLMPYHKVLQ